MRRAAISLFAISLFSIASGYAQRAAPSEQIERGLTSAVVVKGQPAEHFDLASRMAYYGIPGVSIAIIDDYKIVWAKGYGYRDKEHKLPVVPGTLFEAGSISKPVAAAGALWLVDQKKLSLDDNVNEKLKSWHVPDNEFTRQEKVTLRRLLSHSAGLTIHGFPGYEAGTAIPAVPEILDGTKPANTGAVRVDTVPGTKWRYSGGGYTVMQLLITDVTGESFAAFMTENVLRKFGMAHSTYEQPLPENLGNAAATAYDKGKPLAGKYHTYPEMAAAGLWTTPSDLATFGIGIMKSAQGKANPVLTEATTRLMLTRQIGNWGLGFSLEGTPEAPRFSHGGVDAGFEALLECYENGRGAAIMTNGQGGSPLIAEIMLSIAAAYKWPGYAPHERAAIQLSQDALKKLAGRYSLMSREALISIAAKGLDISFDGRHVRLAPESDLVFFPLETGFPDLTFVKDADGKITGFKAGAVEARRTE